MGVCENHEWRAADAYVKANIGKFNASRLVSLTYVHLRLLCDHFIAPCASKVDISTGIICNCLPQFIMEAYCFADGRCLFKQPRGVKCHWN